MKIFVDEPAWLAIVQKEHPLHQIMKEELQKYLQGGHRFYTTNVVVGDVMSRLKQEVSTESSMTFYSIIEEAWLGAYLHILWIGRRTFKDAVRLFNKFPDSRLSLFDCANIVLMNRRNIRFILTSNPAYGNMGFKIVPESEG
ncbi:MAG: hypothetical protein Kow0042_21740 [Calditrichia bacterium]